MNVKGKRVDWRELMLDNLGLPDDWVNVTHIFGGRWDWAEFRAFWSPSERRYFWHGYSGCSCNCWGDQIRGVASFENGDKAALFAGMGRWEEEHWSYRPGPLIDAASDVRTFREKKDYSAA